MNKFDDGYFISKEEKPCFVCEKLANRIEYNYQAYICSLECKNVMNKNLMKSENDSCKKLSIL